MQDSEESLTVAQAAARLGVSADAIRKRIRRGTLRAWKVDDEWRIPEPIGLSAGQAIAAETVPATVQDAARDAVAYLENERDRLLRDNDRLLGVVANQDETIRTQAQTIAELTRRIPPPAAEKPGEAATIRIGAETSGDARQEAAERPKRRGWLDRLLGR